ncbi:MAG: chemotaxis protein CheX [Phycisphaerales bacterium]
MDQNYILAFVKSTKNTFATMLQLDIEVGTPAIKKTKKAAHDISGIIAMTGGIEGTCVLSFASGTAINVIKAFTGMEFKVDDDDFTDAVGELVNMVAGGAKTLLNSSNISISCPTVVVGEGHIVHGHRDTVCIGIPCTCGAGTFAVEIALRETDPAKTVTTSASASA